MGALITKSRTSQHLMAVVTVAPGTRWERKYDYGEIARGAPTFWGRVAWALAHPLRKYRRRRLARDKVAYERRIALEGYIPLEQGQTWKGFEAQVQAIVTETLADYGDSESSEMLAGHIADEVASLVDRLFGLQPDKKEAR